MLRLKKKKTFRILQTKVKNEKKETVVKSNICRPISIKCKAKFSLYHFFLLLFKLFSLPYFT